MESRNIKKIIITCLGLLLLVPILSAISADKADTRKTENQLGAIGTMTGATASDYPRMQSHQR